MKILVISDSHGKREAVYNTVYDEQPDAVIFLGDGISDLTKLQRERPELEIYAVKGNCDFASTERDRLLFELSGKRIFITHGHVYHVKFGLDSLINTAMTAGADIVMYGHTHIPNYSHFRNMLIINPGSLAAHSYGILTIDGENVEWERKER